MRVYLVQHGEAKPEDVDPERRLTENGAGEVRKVADFLRPLNLTPDTVWHSGKPRARETAEILGAALSAQTDRRDGLAPKDPVGPLQQAITEAGGDLMIVGHLPFLGKLAALLVTGDETRDVVSFRYGCVVCLERQESDAWRLAWMLHPDLAVLSPNSTAGHNEVDDSGKTSA